MRHRPVRIRAIRSLVLFALVTIAGFALVACGGDDDATTTPTSLVTPADDSYLGAVVGTWRTVNGATFVTESGTGVYYSVSGVPEGMVLGQILFVTGRIRPVPNVHLINATQIMVLSEDGDSVSCGGTLEKRGGKYFVESSAEGGCGSVELIEVDAEKLDQQVGEETGLTVRWCTVTKEGRMVKADVSSDFECSGPPSFGPNGQIS